MFVFSKELSVVIVKLEEILKSEREEIPRWALMEFYSETGPFSSLSRKFSSIPSTYLDNIKDPYPFPGIPFFMGDLVILVKDMLLHFFWNSITCIYDLDCDKSVLSAASSSNLISPPPVYTSWHCQEGCSVSDRAYTLSNSTQA